jgi:hypothetical protein
MQRVEAQPTGRDATGAGRHPRVADERGRTAAAARVDAQR